MNRYLVFILVSYLCTFAPQMYAAKLQVVTTTQDAAAIVRSIGGKQVQVESLTLGTRDPHFTEATPSMIRRVYTANLLVVIGAELEVGWLPTLLETARNSRVLPGASGYLDLSVNVSLLNRLNAPVSRAQGDVHVHGNPHYWLNPNNGLLMAQAVAARLSQLDPAHAALFRSNLTQFERELKQRLVLWGAALGALKDKPVVAYHKSFEYLAQAFEFRVVAELEPKPGIPPNAAHLQQLIDTIRTQKIRLLILEPYYERRSAAYLSDQTGIKAAVLPQSVGATPNILTYFDLFDAIVRAFQQSGGLSL